MNYTCPYCKHHSTITDPNEYYNWERIYIENSTSGNVGLAIHAVTCPNKDCNKLKLRTMLTRVNMVNGEEGIGIKEWNLMPESTAKILPDYVPTSVTEDYYEACKILNLSPKASATLSRRCLQGMIRDFHKVTKHTLNDEILALKDILDTDTWDSIDAVRRIGNIGAHMEKDVNVIVNVEPEEANLLIQLIEQLIEDWYVAREDKKVRAEKLRQVVQSVEEKKQTKNNLSVD
jgi:hypothetical protein